MWMQVLSAAGFAVVGEQFPLDWHQRFPDANQRGFFESSLVTGINFSTNPNPVTGAYLDPHESHEVAVKVLLPGLSLTQRVYLDRVILSVRGWRSFVASRFRADQMIRAYDAQPIASGPYNTSPMRWWLDHYRALDDVCRRGYPIRVVRYEDVLAHPDSVVASTLEWLGVDCDVSAAIRTVDSTMRTQQDSPTLESLTDRWIEALDEMQALLGRQARPTQAELGRMEAFFREEFAHVEGADPWADRAKPPGS